MTNLFKNYWQRLPDLDWSHILLRIPLALVFITQGMSKLPYDAAGGEAFGLPAMVWLFVIVSEIGAGVGLLVGAVPTLPRIRDISILAELGDIVTRFSGIVMCCVATGVIWTVLKPESILQFILTDYLHFSLWIGGLYFALRGNWAVRVQKNLQGRR
jgi:putative oxidoreductase